MTVLLNCPLIVTKLKFQKPKSYRSYYLILIEQAQRKNRKMNGLLQHQSQPKKLFLGFSEKLV